MRLFNRHCVGVEVIHLVDGESLLHYLFRQTAYQDQSTYPDPDLIFLDIRLPKVDGFEVLKIIREKNIIPTIPVVILTTSEAEQDLKKASQLNIKHYLIKPITLADFVKVISSLNLINFSFLDNL